MLHREARCSEAINSAKQGEGTFEDDVLLLKPHHTEPKALLILLWLAF